MAPESLPTQIYGLRTSLLCSLEAEDQRLKCRQERRSGVGRFLVGGLCTRVKRRHLVVVHNPLPIDKNPFHRKTNFSLLRLSILATGNLLQSGTVASANLLSSVVTASSSKL